MKEDQDQCETQGEPEDNMETYIGCKVIKACPMDSCSFFASQGKDVTNQETMRGYKVRYPDGYISWSPKDVFEEAYRHVNDRERRMCR